jgi:hypothetical protein
MHLINAKRFVKMQIIKLTIEHTLRSKQIAKQSSVFSTKSNLNLKPNSSFFFHVQKTERKIQKTGYVRFIRIINAKFKWVKTF